jgi:hypothetical protein
MDLFPSRKQREFAIWSLAVDEHVRAAAEQRRRDRALLARLGAQIVAARRYMAPNEPIPVQHRRPLNRAATRAKCLAAIAEFAACIDGPLGGLVYDRMRRQAKPDWPNRNTVARHFGSWYAALEAAGLADRAAAKPERFANRSRTALDARLVRQRERVLASVRRFIDENGHVPRAMEYFRWRLERDPDTPTQATVYKLFPGGWNAVRDALVR